VGDTDASLFNEMLLSRYAKVDSMPYFGQAHTTLDIYHRKDTE